MIVDPDFFDHWKTLCLIEELDGDAAAPIYVLRLWAHCQNRKQWRFTSLSERALKALCRFPGNGNKLIASLVASGFVRRSESGDEIIVVGWDEYNAQLIANWKNGKKGGRPRTCHSDYSETHGLPMDNPSQSHQEPIGAEQIGEDKNIAAARACRRDLKLDVEETKAVAARLAGAIQHRSIRNISAEWIWKQSCMGQMLKPGLVVDIASKIKERQIEKPKSYLEKVIREECQTAGLTLLDLEAAMPPYPKREEESVA